MQNTRRSQEGENHLHSLFYAELLTKKGLNCHKSSGLSRSRLPLIWYGQTKRIPACAIHSFKSVTILGFHWLIHETNVFLNLFEYLIRSRFGMRVPERSGLVFCLSNVI